MLLSVFKQTTAWSFPSVLHQDRQTKISYLNEHWNSSAQHMLIRPYTPLHNGKVELSYRKDNEEFYASHKFYSFDNLKKQLAVCQRQYNKFPMRPLNWRSLKQLLISFPNVYTSLTTLQPATLCGLLGFP